MPISSSRARTSNYGSLIRPLLAAGQAGLGAWRTQERKDLKQAWTDISQRRANDPSNIAAKCLFIPNTRNQIQTRSCELLSVGLSWWCWWPNSRSRISVRCIAAPCQSKVKSPVYRRRWHPLGQYVTGSIFQIAPDCQIWQHEKNMYMRSKIHG